MNCFATFELHAGVGAWESYATDGYFVAFARVPCGRGCCVFVSSHFREQLIYESSCDAMTDVSRPRLVDGV